MAINQDAPPTFDLPPDGPDHMGDPAPPSRGRRRVVVAVIAAVLLAAGSAAWWFLARDDGDAAVATMTNQVVEVSTGTFGETVSADGTVAAADTEDLSFSSAGTVTAVNVSAGDTVVAGQVLATLDSAELAADLADAEASLADAQADLDDATDAGANEEEIAVADAAVTSAQDAVEVATEALEGATLVAGIDGTVTTVDLTVGEELGSSGTGGTSLTGTGTGSGQSASTLSDGTTSSATPGAGGGAGGATGGADASSTSSTQIQVVSTGRFEVELGVDSADIDAVEVGQSVDLTISTDTDSTSSAASAFPGGFGPPGMAGPGATQTDSSSSADDEDETDADSDAGAGDVTATGTVTEVGRVADASSGVATYAVTVSFEDDSGEVWAGSSATAEIQVSTREDVTQVSSRAVTTENGTSTVTVALDGTADGRTEEREVTTGETSGDMVEIVSGLEPGDQVVIEVPGFGSFPGGGEAPDLSGGAPPGFSGEMPSGATGGNGNDGAGS